MAYQLSSGAPPATSQARELPPGPIQRGRCFAHALLIRYPETVGKGIATLCLLAGGFICAAGLGILPSEYVAIGAPRGIVVGGGALLAVLGFMSLARDHRVSETITSLIVLALAGAAGWLTFYAPPGTLNRYLPFVPPTVNDALARLLFGLGAAVCVGMAFWGFRRMFR